MQAKRLTMDCDYHDLTYIGRGGRRDLAYLFDNMAEARFHATTFDCFWCGTALYHSRRLPVFANSIGWKSAAGLAAVLREWDPLAVAVDLGRERDISVLPYFRLFEEAYAPFYGDAFFRAHPEYWWQTRCGMYRMTGWPCYSYEEVREHMLGRLDDLVEHGVPGVLFGLSRTHIPWLVAYRWGADGNCFGFNQPVVDEFRRRHGVDLSTFDHVEEVASADHSGYEFVYERRWVGAEPFDMWVFRRLMGEGLGLFLREARRRHPGLYIAIECAQLPAGGRPDEPAAEAPFRIDLEGLCADGTIDEYAMSMNYRLGLLTEELLPRFQHVRESGKQLTAWLNDLFSPTGGGNERLGVTDVAAYVDRFLASGIDGAVVHEAAFLLETEDPAAMWREIGRLAR